MERVLMRCKYESKEEVENETNYLDELKKIKVCKKAGTNMPLVKINLLSVAANKDTNVNLGEIKNNFAVECLPKYKPIILHKLLTRNNTISKTLVYTNSEPTAHKLALFMQLLLLKRNITVGELSIKQHINKFASAEIHVLIGLSMETRYVDIPDVELVISYDLPKYVGDFIHTVGRTAPTCKPKVIFILKPNQVERFKKYLGAMQLLKPKIEEMKLNIKMNNEVNYQIHLEKLKEILAKEKNEKENLEQTKAFKRQHVLSVLDQNASVNIVKTMAS